MFQLTETQQDLQARARDLADGPIRDRAAEVDRTEQYPWDNVELLRENGFVGMTIPREHGGQGLSWLDTAIVVEQIARTCAVTARIAVETNMGGVSAVMAYGSDEQKKLAAGDALALVHGEIHHAARGVRADVHETLRLDLARGRDDRFEVAGLDGLGRDGQSGLPLEVQIGEHDGRADRDDAQPDEDVSALHRPGFSYADRSAAITRAMQK